MRPEEPRIARPGTILRRSARFSPGERLLPDAHEDGSSAALLLEGDNLVFDFGGLVLRGTPPDTEPDRRKGTGLLVRGKNITLRNLRVHGYKIGLMAVGCSGLTIEEGDLSFQWKQRLRSGLEREDLADWMSFHQNEKEEWLRYGAGVYLRDCEGFTVRRTRIVGGQCGLMLTRCRRGLVAENDFSFLSAIGLGLYRSSDNRILHNRLDWCVRGYSHGVYNRGQDSSGILIYEQSSRNVFAYNSATHGGDGFFLWAGQTTMDTGQGGCDDNLLFGNDFSHAPANGIEATFARNLFANNLLLECWHGIWGGFSYATKIVGNVFGLNAEAIAIEHGRDNLIADNRFVADRVGIALWQNETLDPGWAYPKKHETASRDYRIEGNRFDGVAEPLRVRQTAGVIERDNTRRGTPPEPVLTPGGGSVPGREPAPDDFRGRFGADWNPYRRVAGVPTPRRLRGARDAFLPPGTRRGRRYILVDEWGPYDFRRPLLWPRSEEGVHEILGPPGRWRLVGAEGATLSARSGTVPGTVTIRIPKGQAGTTKVELEYVGEATRDHRGIETPAGKPVRFGFSRFVAPIDWTIRLWRWSQPENPADIHSGPDPAHLRDVLAGPPLTELRRDRLDLAGSSFGPDLPADHFVTVAAGRLTVPPGAYLLEIVTDDGCRAWLDGKPILADAWKYQGPTRYPVPLTLGGEHTLQVEHFQIDGYAALSVKILPQPAR